MNTTSHITAIRRTLVLAASASALALAAIPGHAIGSECDNCPDPGGGGGGGNGGGPAAVFTSGPATGAVLDTDSTSFTFTANNQKGATTYECKLDAGNWNACSSPASLQGLADGHHTFSVAAGSLGVFQANPPSRSFTVDTTKPVVSFISGPAHNVRSKETRPTYGFTTSDTTPLSTDCRADFGSFTPCNSTYQPSVALTDGLHGIFIRSIDAVGHVTVAGRLITVDTEAPVVTVTKEPASITNTTPTFDYSAPHDGGADYTFECKVDDGPVQDCSGGQNSGKLTVGPLADGAHTFAVRGTDGVGNQSPFALSFFKIETAILTPVVTPIPPPVVTPTPSVVTPNPTPSGTPAPVETPATTPSGPDSGTPTAIGTPAPKGRKTPRSCRSAKKASRHGKARKGRKARCSARRRHGRRHHRRRTH